METKTQTFSFRSKWEDDIKKMGSGVG